MSKLKTDLEILEFINEQPGRTVLLDDLKAFIGDNANRRVSELNKQKYVYIEPDWFGSGKTTVTLGATGDDLLATHEQEQEEQFKREADERDEKARERKRKKSETRRKLLHDLFIAIVGSLVTILFQKIFK